MKKRPGTKSSKPAKSQDSVRKPAIRDLEPRNAAAVKAGQMWTKGGGASVG